jgi:class 3 adenylate cyclase
VQDAVPPSHLTEKILASRASLEGERKQVTILLADIKDSTELIKDLDPEAAQQLLDPAIHRTLYPDRLAEQVDRLAHHALRGEVWGKALVYCQQAGVRAAAHSAHREAVAYFEQARSWVRRMPLPGARRRPSRSWPIAVSGSGSSISRAGDQRRPVPSC